ncbi:hypothetical protein P152DRAFT_291517 [Eremomyces bilateralis CBS 781.70]|uniref:Uncharacterized protein n=1 Tax=Eremomyces bilateralis CBS 781.70 TaxID=1392243 RepID=A0A6G1G743_9PEZI|nr:uncharacterized protein P152DRAFT_291517 [Eremomyces bilateralis CBS 781.70]KAF1813761.1 hypothetical protein P152DRAFT_291517 [Eremomyces bilateralis CBS 781.70]
MAGIHKRFELPAQRANKEFEWLEPSYDDVFDQYINADLFGATDENSFAGPSSEEFSKLFSSTALTSDQSPPNLSSPYFASTLPHWPHNEYAELGAASPQFNASHQPIYPKSIGRGSLSTSDIPFSLKSNNLQKAEPAHFGSTPSSPSLTHYKNQSRLSSAIRCALRQQSRGAVEKSQWKNSPKSLQPPKMLSPNHYRPRHPETWAARIEQAVDSFPQDFQNSPSSPVPKEFPRLSRQQSRTLSGQASFDHLLSPLSTTYSLPLQGQSTPVTSPTTDSSDSRRISTQVSPTSLYENAAQNSLQTPPQTKSIPISPWTSAPTFDSNFGFPNSNAFSMDKAGSSNLHWWEAVSAGHPSSQSGPMVSAPSHLFDDTASTSLATQGLMIQCEPPASLGIDSLLQQSLPRQNSPATLHQIQTASFPASPLALNGSTPYLRHPPNRMRAHGQRTGGVGSSSGAHDLSPASSRQPRATTREGSASPPRPRRASTRPPGAGTQRRKSGHGQGHGQSKSMCNGAGGSWFVNFTPDDSSKILNGVAPSGSSKTKARREKEAADRRKKLSQAAAKLVMAAGGDLDALEKEGLLAP